MAKELSMYQWLFIGEYLQSWDATDAVKKAGYVGPYARSEGRKLLGNPLVAQEIEKVKNELVAKSTLTIAEVIEDIANVLRADPRDLVEHWHGACRYCHGYDNLYHRTINEYRKAQNDEGMKFNPLGGVGFNARADPNPDCPECHGEGEPYERIRDTRELSKEAAALYIGVERTKNGIKLLTRSKDAAREAAARYLGMNKETVNHNIKKVSDMSDEELEALARGGK